MTYHPYGAPPPYLPPTPHTWTRVPTVAIVAALILLPPLGIALMWLRGGPASVKRIIATVLASFWALLLFLAVLGAAIGPTSPTPRPVSLVADTDTSSAPAPATTPASTTASPTVTAPATSTPPPSPTTTTPPAPVVTSSAPPPAATPTAAAPPAPTTTQPAAPPPPQDTAPAGGTGLVVHPGAFCAPEGATGVTDRGTPMVCGPASDGRNRWHKA